ncbi:DUF3182 family protein [Metapseudomonas otitidis]|uniref:DUF3182 family protein n=1 Tax=Metapseudomonas otitidis TaxID=319939 RepID=UPI0039FB90A6
MACPADVRLLRSGTPLAEHEACVQRLLGGRLARLLGCPFDPAPITQVEEPGRHYLLPDDTLVGPTQRHGLSHIGQLFGGWVAEPFMATKAIGHPLAGPGAQAPRGWSDAFAEQAGDAVLEGFSVFSPEDARRAGQRLLERGPLRAKPVRAKAGRGQQVIRQLAELDALVAQLPTDELATWGLVLEEQLEDVATYSVGQVEVNGLLASYHGVQHLTRDGAGEPVYGGSDLYLVRGGYDALLAEPLPASIRLAVQQARRYEEAALHSYPDLLASRRNYDVARGRNAAGQWRSGVLEQSWRVGGASAAEVFALDLFDAEPACRRVHARTRETYGEPRVPADAWVLFDGEVPGLGRLCKYVEVIADDRP